MMEDDLKNSVAEMWTRSCFDLKYGNQSFGGKLLSYFMKKSENEKVKSESLKLMAPITNEFYYKNIETLDRKIKNFDK
jgi:hypothetical protein